MLGLQVLLRPLERSNEKLLPREYRTIVVKDSMRGAMQRCALAHGIAHWELAHPDDRPKNEHAANRYAGLFLIDPRELADVIAWCDTPERAAQELDVTPRILAAVTEGRTGPTTGSSLP